MMVASSVCWSVSDARSNQTRGRVVGLRTWALEHETIERSKLMRIEAESAAAARKRVVEFICITDILDEPLALARQVGADMTINVGQGGISLEQETQRNGGFEIAFEVSGNPAGLATCLESVRPGATVVQVGTLSPGKFLVAGNLVMSKEIDLRGAIPFDREFAHSVACLDRGLIDVTPLLTARVPAEDASAAFDLAKQRNKHSKVQITF
jgi:L-idonate 5-dehydrogenase